MMQNSGGSLTREITERFRNWFENYTNNFVGRDEDLDFAVALKQEHTRMVIKIINELSEALGFTEEELLIAEMCALFHDVGRFPQFARYGTFKDTCSENHALLGIKVLNEEGILETLTRKTAGLISSAVENHNCLTIPDTLSPEELLFARLLRDADKIDIYRVTSGHYTENNGTGGSTVNLGLPDNKEISISIAEAVANGEPVNYEICSSVDDFKLLQLGWVYDMNFPESFQLLNKKRYLQVILGTLPADAAVIKVKTRVLKWIERKVQGPPTEINRSTSE